MTLYIKHSIEVISCYPMEGYMVGNMSEAHVIAMSSEQILQWATNAPGLGLLAASIKTRDVIYEDNYLAIISMYKLKIYLT